MRISCFFQTFHISSTPRLLCSENVQHLI